MTVCVAAVCENSRVIVTASDRLLTWTHTSTETALKLVRVHRPYWISMIAGENITLGVESVATSVRETFAAVEHKPSVLEMQRTLLAAWRDVGNQRAEATVLSPFRLDLSTFVKDGRKFLGDPKYYELLERVAAASRLQCDLLVCGFDQNTIPALLVCSDDFGCQDYTRAGFAAIGSGHTEALASLSFHDYDTMCSIDTAIYRVCAAKFMAERALGVGRETLVLCLRDDGRTRWIFKRHIEPIRKLWEEEGRPCIPSQANISETLAPILSQQEWQEL